MAKYLLDTNHFGAAVSHRSFLHRELFARHNSGDRFGTCVPVLCEIEVGRLQVSDPEEYSRRSTKLLRRIVKSWQLDLEVARIYGQIYQELKGKGRVLSSVDMMVAALARRDGLIVLTTDRDFDALPDISSENWLEPV